MRTPSPRPWLAAALLLPLLAAPAAAQRVEARVEIESNGSFDGPFPEECNVHREVAGAALARALSASGSCEANGPTFGFDFDGTARVDRDGTLHATADVLGHTAADATEWQFVSSTAEYRDVLHVEARPDAVPFGAIVFDLYLHGGAGSHTTSRGITETSATLSALATIDGDETFTSMIRIEGRDGPFSSELPVPPPQRATGQLVLMLAPGTTATTLDVAYRLALRAYAAGGIGKPDGVALRWSGGAHFGNTAGLAGVRLLDAGGVDVTRGYALSTAAGPIATVPEPATVALLGAGLAGVALAARRRSRPARGVSRTATR